MHNGASNSRSSGRAGSAVPRSPSVTARRSPRRYAQYAPEQSSRFTMRSKENEEGIKWLEDVQEHDYPAAESYLLIVYGASEAKKLLARLRSAEIVQFRAKDLFRASQLSLLGVSNSHVEKDKKEDQERNPTFAVAPGQGRKDREGCHCRRLPSPLRNLWLRRGRMGQVQDCMSASRWSCHGGWA